MTDDAPSEAADAGTERDEACHDDGQAGVEGDILAVDDPVADEPEQARDGPRRRGEA